MATDRSIVFLWWTQRKKFVDYKLICDTDFELLFYRCRWSTYPFTCMTADRHLSWDHWPLSCCRRPIIHRSSNTRNHTVCLFVCLGFYYPAREFIWRRHHCRWRDANFDLCSALMANEQWEFFSIPHLPCGAVVYNDHLRGPLTLTPITERLSFHYLFTT